MNRRGCGQTGGISAPLAGPPTLCLHAAGVTACQGLSATTQRATGLSTHHCVVHRQHRPAFSRGPQVSKIWLLSPRYHFLFARASCPCFTLLLLFLSPNSSSPSLSVYHVGCQEVCQNLSQQDPLPSHIKCPLTTGKIDLLGLSAGQSLASTGLKGNNRPSTVESCRVKWSHVLEQCHNPPGASSTGANTS